MCGSRYCRQDGGLAEPESCASNHRREENDPTNPDNEQKNHQIAKKCHGRFIMHHAPEPNSFVTLAENQYG